jgi:ribose transport system substrate-binding protein
MLSPHKPSWLRAAVAGATPSRPSGHRGSSRRRYRGLAVVSIVAICVAGCGSTSHSSSLQPAGTSPATAATGAAGVAATKAALAGYVQEPTRIPQTVALPSKPPTGKKIGYVVCSQSTCIRIGTALKAAASALGWTVLTANVSTTDPGAAFQSLINQRVDYLTVSGLDPNEGFQPQLAEARAMHIPVFLIASTALPGGATNGIYSNNGDTTLQAGAAKMVASWLTADSNGSANILYVNLPVYPVLVAQEGSVKSTLQSQCPGCSFHDLNLTVSEVQGGTVPQTVVNYLRTNANVNYVDVAVDSIASGLASALKTAGLSSRVKMVGVTPSLADLGAIVNGTEAAGVQNGLESQGWAVVDQMARYAENVWTLSEERAVAGGSVFLVDTPAQAAVYASNQQLWEGPAGYQTQYEKLWKAS